MEADEKDGLYRQQTALNWFLDHLPKRIQIALINTSVDVVKQAKQMEKEQMVKFAEFVSSHPDKNKNYKGEMLHAKSKYDGAERTVDLLEQYYNKTYGK